MHTDDIRANKLGAAVHHNDKISISEPTEFYGNGTQGFGNEYAFFFFL